MEATLKIVSEGSGYSSRVFSGIDISNDGRALIVDRGNEEFAYFEEDSVEPKWWIRAKKKYKPESDTSHYLAGAF